MNRAKRAKKSRPVSFKFVLPNKVTLHQGLPFDVRISIPNEVTLEAMREAEHPENLETFDSVDELSDI